MAGRHCEVVEDDFYNKLEMLSIQAGKKNKILAGMCNEYAKRMTQ